jgi:hypothetical protein
MQKGGIMPFNFILFVVLMLLLSSIATAEVVELDHPVMEAKDKMQGSKGVDVVKLTVSSDGTQLKTTALLHKEVKAYITDSAGLTLAVYLDTDNNPATGGEIPFCGKNGFERRIELSICLDYGGGMHICGGGMSGKKASGYLNGQSVFNYDSKKVAWDPQTGVDVKGSIQSNKLESSVSYQSLGVHPGSTVRISAYEADAQFKAGCFDDALMKLK